MDSIRDKIDSDTNNNEISTSEYKEVRTFLFETNKNSPENRKQAISEFVDLLKTTPGLLESISQ